MALLNQYVIVPNQLATFFERIREGQAPESFTRQHLKDIGFASSNHRALIPLLKGLGFLSADGSPTQRYKTYLDSTQSRKVLGEAISENYGDIFQIKKNPTKADRAAIAGKFKSTYNVSENTANNLASTFLALYELSDHDIASGKKTTKTIEQPKDETSENSTGQKETADFKGQLPPHKNNQPITLSYNLQIHLPATKDIEVYNAIFKSIKSHIIDP